MTDFFNIFYWWILIFIIGFASLPLTFFLFKRFFDRGYAFGKIIGLLIVSYLVWLFGSLKLIPFIIQSVGLFVFLTAAFNFYLAKKKKIDLKAVFKSRYRIFIFEEILFFLALVVWSVIRGYQPDIEGLEKFMDYGFVNSILRSKYFPPADMWLAGETINYYYFGHLISAVLTMLSGIDSAITYNLMMATIFALSLTAAFSLAANLFFLDEKGNPVLIRLKLKILNWEKLAPAVIDSQKFKILIAGSLGAFLLALGGNFHPLYWYLKNGNFKEYWYPDATRFIVEKFGAADNTIHEFPIYSYVVADLHGHMINIPNVLLILALVLTIIKEIQDRKKTGEILPLVILISLCLAIAFMTNAWDYPIYLLVIGGAFLFSHRLAGFKWVDSFIKTFTLGFIIVISSLVFSLLFHLNFKNIAQGVAKTDFHSPPWMLPVLWGFPLLNTIIFLVPHLADIIKRKKIFLSQTDALVSVMLSVSWFLVILPEFVYIKDIYIHSHQRANTMFKLTYQSFMMFALVESYIMIKTLASLKNQVQKAFFLVLISSLLLFIFIYPHYAVKSYYGLKNYRGLYGLNYLQQGYPDDYQAVLWLKKNVSGQPVIAEAVGESYTQFARVSANTGIPTVLGWRVHEWLWRGSFDEAGKRTEEVSQIYQSEDLNLTKNLLNKYNVKYIFLGDLERQAYPQLQEDKFEKLGKVIFSSSSDQTKIYQYSFTP